MKTKMTKRKLVGTVAGAAIGAAIAGPLGAVAGGLAANRVNPVVQRTRRKGGRELRGANPADDPLHHAHLKRILVPLDFSPPSRRAMRFARAWAGLFGAEVCLLHVVEPTAAGGEFNSAALGVVQRDLPGRAELALSQLARKGFPDSLSVKIIVRTGTAFDQIAAEARKLHADLIIIGTHGYTGLRRVLLGSTAEKVARHAQCPVLILRRRRTR